MKKLMMALIILLFASSSAFALTAFNPTTPLASGGETICKPSNNVNGGAHSGATQFSAITKHLSGTRNYATASTDTKIYWVAVATNNKGTTTFEITLSASDTANFSSWTAL